MEVVGGLLPCPMLLEALPGGPCRSAACLAPGFLPSHTVTKDDGTLIKTIWRGGRFTPSACLVLSSVQARCPLGCHQRTWGLSQNISWGTVSLGVPTPRYLQLRLPRCSRRELAGGQLADILPLSPCRWNRVIGKPVASLPFKNSFLASFLLRGCVFN